MNHVVLAGKHDFILIETKDQLNKFVEWVMSTLESIKKANDVSALDKIKYIVDYKVMLTRVNE